MTGDQNEDVESVLASMSANLEVSESSVPLEHPRYCQYKNYGTEVQRQKKRRSDWLNRQKEDRSAIFDKHRFQHEEQQDEPTSSVEVQDEEMSELKNSSETNKPGSWRKAMRSEKAKSNRPDLKGRLMYSEWLIDIPADFAQNWIMIPAPKAKRVIILLEHRQCQLFTKIGKLRASFSIPTSVSSPLIMDGFLSHNNIVYILDFISYGNFNWADCEFECRRMLGKSFLEENGILTGVNKPETWKFEFLEPAGVCTKEVMERFMSVETPYRLDGLMFYYKDGFYTPGITPLVGWLKPWMMPDILDVAVNPVYMENAKGTPQEFMDNFAKNHASYGQALTKEELLALDKMEVTE